MSVPTPTVRLPTPPTGEDRVVPRIIAKLAALDVGAAPPPRSMIARRSQDEVEGEAYELSVALDLYDAGVLQSGNELSRWALRVAEPDQKIYVVGEEYDFVERKKGGGYVLGDASRATAQWGTKLREAITYSILGAWSGKEDTRVVGVHAAIRSAPGGLYRSILESTRQVLTGEALPPRSGVTNVKQFPGEVLRVADLLKDRLTDLGNVRRQAHEQRDARRPDLPLAENYVAQMAAALRIDVRVSQFTPQPLTFLRQRIGRLR